MPSTVEQLHRELSPHGLSVVAVNIQENQTIVAAWAREKNISVPIVLDTDGKVTREYGVMATPTSFLVDRHGRLLGRMIGPRDWASPTGKALFATLLTTAPNR